MTECQEYVKGLVELGFKSKFSMYLTRIAGDYYGVNKAVLFVIFDYESNKVVQILFDLYHEI